MILNYLFGLGTVITILVIWFFSPFKTSIGQIFNQEFVTQDEFDIWLLTKNTKLGILAGCWICFSFWTSVAVSTLLTLINDLPCTFVPVATFTYPAIAYLYKSIVTKK